MTRPLVIICVGIWTASLAACGGSSAPTPPTTDRASITRAAESYFILDRTPDLNLYCASYVELQRSDSFGSGGLVDDADQTESRCLKRWKLISPTHTGWPDATIQRIETDGDRGHVLVTFRTGGRMTERNAWVGKVADGDWRILNAGYD